MIKDIIIHISAGPHARLPDTDSQDQKGETPKASEDTEHRIPGGSLPAVKSDWERTGKDRRTARTSPAAL